MPPASPAYGDAWTYESIVGAVPGTDLSTAAAVTIQVVSFEAAVLALAAAYGLPDAAVAGTVAVAVAGVGSVLMTRIASANRILSAPTRYYRLLFGSSIEVVLGVVAFCALVTYLFVVEPASSSLLTELFGPEPPVPAVFLALLVLWDLCYRIGTSWWTAVVSLVREVRFGPTGETAAAFRRLDRTNVVFALCQLALVPFVADRPVLVAAIGGHVLAVTAVSAVAVGLSTRRCR
ncbi:DUF7530 family protein [Halorarum halobium]|uniref:DUF7530 family protein n=1 Tax=Halorarum halobium TaxID=3075121 RepID=UPI0028ACFA32|nr:hypothetical protein [Halobaculum sp. XH14]